LEIRPTTQADADAITRIVAQGGVFDDDEAREVRALLDYYLEDTGQDEFLFLTATDAARVVGFACYGRIALTKYNYELSWIATAKEALRGGVGSALLQAVETCAREKGGRYLILETSISPLYAPARAFYERHGYHVVARIPDYYDDGDAMVMYRKRLVNSKQCSVSSVQ
jgi:ribosomal protein S18 acetylase RimI-like enzyme